MILTRIALRPFGCFADREVRFAPGLNVVLGANEAGKSTLFNAVRSALLRTKLSKAEFEKYIARFLPVSGGDTAAVELEFRTGAGRHLLRRTWGPRRASELVLPGGGSLSDDDAIKDALDALLPAKKGTFMKILMTGQAELAATLEALSSREGGEAMTDLADILRNAIAETGGVSADLFKKRLEEEISASFSHWDAERKCPEKNRGIANPWSKEVGLILAEHYRAEGIRAELARAREVEDGLDEANARLRAVMGRAAEAERFLSENKKAAADAGEKRTLEARLEALALEQEKLRKANREWPVAEDKVKELEKTLGGFAARRELLEKEKGKAAEAEAGRNLRERMGRIAGKKKIWEDIRRKLDGAPSVDANSVASIRELAGRVEVLKKTAAAELSVKIAAHRPLEIEVQEDFSKERIVRLASGETVKLEASVRARITSPDMELEVKYRDADRALAGRELGEAQDALKKALADIGAAGPADSEDRLRSVELLRAEERIAKRNLEDELAGDALQDLEREFAKRGPASESRALAAVEADLARLDVELQAAVRESKELRERVAEWISVYGTPEKLLDALTDARGKEGEIRKKLAACAPLPRGFADAETFLRDYEAARETGKRLAEEKNTALVRKAELESRAPETSSEELGMQMEEAESVFRSAARRGEALRRVRALSEKLLASSDAAVFTGMRKELEALVSAMTDGRYNKVEMQDSIPSALEAAGGGKLGLSMLSAGTKDMLALALRLAMASYFIADKGGVLMMDDPLVDMDPDRQKAAAHALREFSSSRQLILFTCHPGAAELLGGNRILL